MNVSSRIDVVANHTLKMVESMQWVYHNLSSNTKFVSSIKIGIVCQWDIELQCLCSL